MDGFMMFKKALQKHFDEMQKEATHLFEVNVDKDELWNTYLDSFPAGTNEIFRERREHDCSCCRQFIKNIGSAVTIKDNQIHMATLCVVASHSINGVSKLHSEIIKQSVFHLSLIHI